MQTFEKRLRHHARRLEISVPEAASASLLQRFEQEARSRIATREPPWASMPLAAVAALAITLVVGVVMQREASIEASHSAAESVVTNALPPALPATLTRPFEDVSQGVTQAESALLEEWGFIKADLRRLRGSLGREWESARKEPSSA